VPRDQKWTAWGDKNKYNVVTFPDVERWAGVKELTFAEVSNVFPGGTLNPIQTAASNSFYVLYMYGSICFSDAVLQYIDGRDNTFHNAIATDVSSSPDGLTWTIKMKQGVLFHSGVEMTADDLLYTNWAVLQPDAASVGLGSAIQYLGNVVDFTWLDGTTTTSITKLPLTKQLERVIGARWTDIQSNSPCPKSMLSHPRHMPHRLPESCPNTSMKRSRLTRGTRSLSAQQTTMATRTPGTPRSMVDQDPIMRSVQWELDHTSCKASTRTET